MPPTLDLDGKVCPRHSTMPAVARCFSCFKPVCEICLVQADNHDFCSDKCAEAHARTDRSFQDFLAVEQRLRRKRNIRRAITTIVFLFILFGAVKFWIENPELVDGWIEAGISGFGSIVDMIKETIQGFTAS